MDFNQTQAQLNVLNVN